MISGLMEQEEMEKLGFTDEVSWETEEAEKKFLFEKIIKLKEKAQKNADLQKEFQKTRVSQTEQNSEKK